MFSLYEALPKYLLEKFQLLATVTFAAFFSIVFIMICVPFSNNAWFQLGQNRAFGFTLAFFVISLAVVALSKRGMYAIRSRGLSYLEYILWNFGECVVISLLYSFFTIEGAEMGILALDENMNFYNLSGSALGYAAVCLGVPYVVSAQYFAIEDKNNIIRMMNYGNVVGDFPAGPQEEKRINLFDNNGLMKFSINQDNLYFIEADDNYIQVWYADSNGDMKQYMLRCRLKTIEDSFAESDLVRCHRKYIVNISKVRVLKSADKGYMLDLDIDAVDPIPISKTYEQAVLARFNSR